MISFAQAYAGGSPVEVQFSARVTSSPRFFFGSRTKAWHEQFNVQTASGPVQIIDNVKLAPRVPVQPGDTIACRGEMVHDRGKPPIVHWTHHDPSGRHQDGFIELQGRVYA